MEKTIHCIEKGKQIESNSTMEGSDEELNALLYSHQV